MDLRPHIQKHLIGKNKMIEEGVALIKSGHLFYQPFILADDIEVGEGQNHADRYAGVEKVFDLNAYAPGRDVGERKQPADLAHFRNSNQQYRAIYENYADTICKQFNNNISGLTFGEIGCNTGLNLFNLAVRGAKGCQGYDWNDMNPVFGWLNKVLKTNVEFKQGIYNNLYHQFEGFDVPEVDVMINTVFTNHQCDPLLFLAYICDRAKKGVFLSALTAKDHTCAVHYPEIPPHELMNTGRKFPLFFYNGVEISEKLLLLSFKILGFEEVEVVERFVPDSKWDYFQFAFTTYYAKRTSEVRSAYWENKITIPYKVNNEIKKAS